MGDKTEKNKFCRLRIVKTDNNKFKLVLCVFNTSAQEVLDHMQVGGLWARNMSGYVLARDWT